MRLYPLLHWCHRAPRSSPLSSNARQRGLRHTPACASRIGLMPRCCIRRVGARGRRPRRPCTRRPNPRPNYFWFRKGYRPNPKPFFFDFGMATYYSQAKARTWGRWLQGARGWYRETACKLLASPARVFAAAHVGTSERTMACALGPIPFVQGLGSACVIAYKTAANMHGGLGLGDCRWA